MKGTPNCSCLEPADKEILNYCLLPIGFAQKNFHKIKHLENWLCPIKRSNIWTVHWLWPKKDDQTFGLSSVHTPCWEKC